ncbi:MAG: hypothetical protein SF097_13325 [Acidobacteriota bacterium]|nr:hypothetical protein [Acidobacteriota bacterium]
MFPTTSQILNNYLLPMAVSLFALLLVAVFAVWLLRSARKDAGEGKSDLRPKLFSAAALLVWIAGTVFFNWPMLTALRHRIHPSQIAELRVRPLGNDKKTPVVINDRAQISEGLNLLANAAGYNSVGQERFIPDGYEIEIKPEGAADYLPTKLTAYRQTRRPPGGAVQVSVVAVSINSETDGINFSSGKFHTWLKKYVDPLFVEKPMAVAP